MAPPPKSGSSAKPAEMSLDDLDFGSLENTEAAEPVAGEATDWLGGSAPSTESGSSVKPTAMSLDDLDFEKLSSPAQPLEPLQGDVPDWLSAFSSEPAPDAEATSHARHAMPEHFPEVDFDKLPIEPLPANAGSSGDRDFDFSGVAQPANLMNTNKDSGSQSFTFEQKPAWMRKGKASGAGPGQGAKPSEASSDADDDVPDWLKE